MNLRAFFLAAVASLAAANADVVMIDHDQVEPFAQPEPTTDSEKTAVKFKPQLHISFGCHPYPAVSANGSVSAGLKWGGWADGDCKGSSLGSQVYSRSQSYKDKWAIMYAWYFPKGKRRTSTYRSEGVGGVRHYWSYGIVWTDSSLPDKSTILGVSMSAGVGYRKVSPPKSMFVIDGTTVKFDSYKSVWGRKLGVRLTKETGETQDLITWEQMTEEARNALVETDFDVDGAMKKITMPLSDDAFAHRLKKSYPF